MRWILPTISGVVVVLMMWTFAIEAALDEITRDANQQLEALTRIVEQMDRNLKEGLAAE